MAFKKEVVEIIEPRDIFVGNAKAEITLEEFGEYESEVCANANEIVKKLLIEYDGVIRFNFRHFPLTNIHQRSLKAGEAAVATGQEGKFWEMHNILFANRKNLGTTSLKLYSKEAGVNNKRFLDDLVNATYGWQVQGDLREGINRGVKTVPTFFVNGERVEKNTYEDIKKGIEEAIKNVKKKPKVTKVVPVVMDEEEVVETKVALKYPAKGAVKPPKTKKEIVKTVAPKVAKVAKKIEVKTASAKPKAKVKQRA
ncbi:MAG: thioredoxin domain-containing protein [Ferruginibacter sp.]|nr:thioredoxin domain-containing protein [Ferruginibacter sp.]